jgi:MoaA/NifB/PqqE/SkfB family radical SAM enzyme
MKTFAKKCARKMGISFNDLMIPQYLTSYNFLQGKAFNPVKVTFELTYACNLRCQMCPIVNAEGTKITKEQREKELSTREITDLLGILKKLGVKVILLTGGEPFIRKDIDELVHTIKQKGFECWILSNGYFLNEKHASALVGSGVDLISFSMDGPQEIHNEIRGAKDSFQKICESVRLIEDEKRRLKKNTPRIFLNCTISALNQGSISQVVDSAHHLGVKAVNYLWLYYTNENNVTATKNVMKVGELKPENQVLSEAIRQVNSATLIEQVALSRAKGKEYGIQVGFNPPLRDDEIEKRFYDENFSFSSKCFYPWFQTRLDPYGNVYPCSLDVSMGNVREKSFPEIWNGSRYVNFRKQLRSFRLLPKCIKCCKLVNRNWSNLPTFNFKKRRV